MLIQENEQAIKINVAHRRGLEHRMMIIQKIRYDKALQLWENSIQVIDKSNNHLKIYNTDKIIYLYKYFLKKLSRFNQFPIQLSINPTNGIIQIGLNSFIHFPTPSAMHKGLLA